MEAIIKYAPAVLIVLFIGYFFVNKSQQEKNFKNEIRKIDSARGALLKKVDSIKSKTHERDSVLSKILTRNLEIIDTLNKIQNTLKINKQEIDKKIEESKEVIEEYWKNN